MSSPLPKQQITILHAGCSYSVDFSSSIIGTVTKTYEDSGMTSRIKFSSLSKKIRELLIKEILNGSDIDLSLDDYDFDQRETDQVE